MNIFLEHGKKATSTAVPRLVGVIKKRSEARVRYTEIVAELASCEDQEMLEAFLVSIAHEIAQFRAEITFYWEGEGDFLGLAREIEAAKARCDDLECSRGYEKGTEA